MQQGLAFDGKIPLRNWEILEQKWEVTPADFFARYEHHNIKIYWVEEHL